MPNAQIKALPKTPRLKKPAVGYAEFLLKALSLTVHMTTMIIRNRCINEALHYRNAPLFIIVLLIYS